jgi:hypothetical protein
MIGKNARTSAEEIACIDRKRACETDRRDALSQLKSWGGRICMTGEAADRKQRNGEPRPTRRHHIGDLDAADDLADVSGVLHALRSEAGWPEHMTHSQGFTEPGHRESWKDPPRTLGVSLACCRSLLQAVSEEKGRSGTWLTIEETPPSTSQVVAEDPHGDVWYTCVSAYRSELSPVSMYQYHALDAGGWHTTTSL